MVFIQIEQTLNHVLKNAFDIFKKQYVVLILSTLVALLGMIFIITIPPLTFGLYYVALRVAQGKEVEVSDVFHGFGYFFRSWGLAIVSAIGIALGFVLLVLPGLFLMVVWQYVVVIMLLEGTGVFKSLGRSYELGKKNFLFSLVFMIIMWVLSSIGGLTKIGVLLTMPFGALCMGVATLKLTEKQTKKVVKPAVAKKVRKKTTKVRKKK